MNKENHFGIIIDASKIYFCPGPCKFNKYKDDCAKLKNKIMYDFKPNFGGRYDFFEYPINYKKNIYLILKNLRICRNCYYRYNAYWKNNNYESLEKDAYKIQKKIYENFESINFVEF
tara:strand:- start:357 stop:707 length:351 start_codon:yes stop_codon:yes gene_type:complete